MSLVQLNKGVNQTGGVAQSAAMEDTVVSANPTLAGYVGDHGLLGLQISNGTVNPAQAIAATAGLSQADVVAAGAIPPWVPIVVGLGLCVLFGAGIYWAVKS